MPILTRGVELLPASLLVAARLPPLRAPAGELVVGELVAGDSVNVESDRLFEVPDRRGALRRVSGCADVSVKDSSAAACTAGAWFPVGRATE